MQLARDDEGPVERETAGGALHWAPRGHAGLRERMAQISAWVATHAPRLFVVDVSVEVTVLVRAMGVPTVVMALPGVRDDSRAPARLPARRRDHRALAGVGRPCCAAASEWRAKTHAVGAISRFDGPRRPPTTASWRTRGACCVLSGPRRHGAHARRCSPPRERETPGWTWTVLGPPGTRWVADPWPLLCAADVVVTHAGQNAIADVAAARRPAVIVPQPRPHDEQATTAARAGRRRPRRRLPALACCGRWADTLERAVQLGGDGWERWSTAGRRQPRCRDSGPRCDRAKGLTAMRTAVITIVAGRHEHLVRQRAALDPTVPQRHVVVAMGDGEAERCRALRRRDEPT